MKITASEIKQIIKEETSKVLEDYDLKEQPVKETQMGDYAVRLSGDGSKMSIRPEGTGVNTAAGGKGFPIHIEDNTVFVYGNINDEDFTNKIDLSNAMEGGRMDEAYEMTDLTDRDPESPMTDTERDMDAATEQMTKFLFDDILTGGTISFPTGERDDLDGFLAALGNMVVTGGISNKEAMRMLQELSNAAQSAMTRASMNFVDEDYIEDQKFDRGEGDYSAYVDQERDEMEMFEEDMDIKKKINRLEDEYLEKKSTAALAALSKLEKMGKYKMSSLRKKMKLKKERKLTKAEKDKREEVAMAIEKDNPGMAMDKKMAIATATAKRSA